MTGGGSGGHITPILAVARELKKLQPDVEIVYVGQKGDRLADIPANDPNIDKVYSVRAGKFRRYHGVGLRQLLDIPTLFKNIRDAFYVLIGIWQSFWLLKKIKPAVIFTRGGFVSVPVAFGATLGHIPYVTHDSDSTPSLANRIIARRAVLHTVALPKEIYPYPLAKTVTVGVPIQDSFSLVDAVAQEKYRAAIGFAAYRKVLFVTGGGLGALRLNDAVINIASALLQKFPDLAIVHNVGRMHEADVNQAYDTSVAPEQRSRVAVKGFVTDLYNYSGAADVIITRAGGSSLAEFAAQGKACIIVPNPQLTGGHQTKNAQALVAQNAVLVVDESQLKTDALALQHAVEQLFQNETERQTLGVNLAKLAHPAAARELAVLLLEQTKTAT